MEENRSLAIFDMDGTILESMDYWRNLSVEVAREKGYCIPDALADELQYVSFGKAAKRIMEEYGGKLELSEEQICERMQVHYESDIGVRPGAKELLAQVKASGARMILASATPRWLCEIALAKHDLLSYFEDIFNEGDFGVAKGNPEFFQHLLEKYDVLPENTTLYEDAHYSVKAAKSLGIRAVVTEDRHQRQKKEELLLLADEYYTEGFCHRVK